MGRCSRCESNSKCSACGGDLEERDMHFCGGCRCQSRGCHARRQKNSYRCKRHSSTPTPSNSSTRTPCPFQCNSVPCRHSINKPKKVICTNCKSQPAVNDSCGKFKLCGSCKCYEIRCPNQKAQGEKYYCTPCKLKRTMPNTRPTTNLGKRREKTTPWKCSGCGFQNPGFIKKCGNDVPYWQPAKGCGKRRTTERRRLNSA